MCVIQCLSLVNSWSLFITCANCTVGVGITCRLSTCTRCVVLAFIPQLGITITTTIHFYKTPYRGHTATCMHASQTSCISLSKQTLNWWRVEDQSSIWRLYLDCLAWKSFFINGFDIIAVCFLVVLITFAASLTHGRTPFRRISLIGYIHRSDGLVRTRQARSSLFLLSRKSECSMLNSMSKSLEND